MVQKWEIEDAIKHFGYMLPNGKRSNNWAFAKLIKDKYSLNNPLVKRIYEAVRSNTDLYYYRLDNKCKVVRI